MTYSKNQVWGMSSNEVNELFFQKNVEVRYEDGSVRTGYVNAIECAANTPHLPVSFRIENETRINIMDNNIVEIRVE